MIMAMQHAWCQGRRKVIFEGDSKSIIEQMQGKSINFGCYKWVREACQWQRRFEEVQFKWTARTNNTVADLLAKYNSLHSQLFQSYFYPPHFISETLHSNHVQSS